MEGTLAWIGERYPDMKSCHITVVHVSGEYVEPAVQVANSISSTQRVGGI